MNIDVLAIIIGAFILVCILICYSCAKVSGNCSDQERKDELFQIVYQKGYDAGYLAGDRDGYSAGIRRMSVMRKERVDVAPGPDSIREWCTPALIGRPEKWAENEKAEAPHD